MADEVILFKKRRKGEKKAELERVLVKSYACGKQWRGASISRARAPDNIIIRWRELERALKTDEETLFSRGKKRAKNREGETSSTRPFLTGHTNTPSS